MENSHLSSIQHDPVNGFVENGSSHITVDIFESDGLTGHRDLRLQKC